MRARDFLEKMRSPYRPRTPNAALRAAELELLPPEVYTYIASSVIPLHAENVSLEELDRILGQRNRNLETNLFLGEIFEKLLESPDAEIALFAAESLSLIEYSYTKRIEDLRVELEETHDPDLLRESARLYYELALLNQKKKAIRTFYLREAFGVMRSLGALVVLEKEDIRQMVRLVMALGLFYQAREFLKHYPDDPEMRFLEAEAEFSAGNFSSVFCLCRIMEDQSQFVTTEERNLARFWLGHER